MSRSPPTRRMLMPVTPSGYATGNITALFGDQRLARLLQIGTLGLLLVPFATPILGLLRREMDFRALAVLNVGGAASAALVTVCLGVLGLGAASYVWGTIAGNAGVDGPGRPRSAAVVDLPAQPGQLARGALVRRGVKLGERPQHGVRHAAAARARAHPGL